MVSLLHVNRNPGCSPNLCLDHLSWYTDHLSTILTHENAPKVKVAVHITRGDPEKQLGQNPATSGATTVVPSTNASVVQIPLTRSDSKSDSNSQIEEKIPISRVRSASSSIFKAGRPDVEAEVRDAIESTPKTQRVLVAACGPAQLMKSVRNTTAACIKADAPSIELHLEEFGW